MGGPGSGNKGRGSRRETRGGSRGRSQVRGWGRATAPTIQEQLLYEEEEEDRIRESHQEERTNDPDENEISFEEDVVPNEEVRSIQVELPKDACKTPTFEKSKWPSWRIHCWENWHIVYSSEKVFAQCKHCNDGKYHHGHSDSFSNFLRHLRRSHEEEYNKVKAGGKQVPPNQSCMKNFLATKIPKDTQKKIDILVAEMIVLDNLPLTILQRDGFRRLISFIAPTYNIPSYEKMRDTIIPSIYARTAEVVKTVLKSCDVVTIMLDLWSSNSMFGFMGVSCSSVTADYVPFTCFLKMKEMPQNHTAEAILSESECVVSDWELNEKALSSLQLKCLKEFVTLLEPFKIATDVFQKDTETVGLVIPFYLDLVNQCSLDPRVNQEAKFITSCKTMAEELSKSLSKRMGWVLKDTFFVLGSVLDPRIKGTWITAAGEEEEKVIVTVKELPRLRYRTVGNKSISHSLH